MIRTRRRETVLNYLLILGTAFESVLPWLLRVSLVISSGCTVCSKVLGVTLHSITVLLIEVVAVEFVQDLLWASFLVVMAICLMYLITLSLIDS